MNSECYENRNDSTDEISAITGDKLLVRSQSVVSRNVAGETLIVPVRGRVGDLASIYSFNETGSLIWKLLENPTTLRKIVEATTREFNVTQEQAERDATRFVTEMFSIGLVEIPKPVNGTQGPVGRES